MPNSKPSLLHLLAAITAEQRLELLKSLDAESLSGIQYLWRLWARPKQLPPPTNWQVWLLMAGRGFGKTRAGAEWIRALGEGAEKPELGLVGATFDDVRQVMVEGPSGVLSISPKHTRPQWFVSRRLLVWPNGVRETVFSADYTIAKGLITGLTYSTWEGQNTEATVVADDGSQSGTYTVLYMKVAF